MTPSCLGTTSATCMLFALVEVLVFGVVSHFRSSLASLPGFLPRSCVPATTTVTRSTTKCVNCPWGQASCRVVAKLITARRVRRRGQQLGVSFTEYSALPRIRNWCHGCSGHKRNIEQKKKWLSLSLVLKFGLFYSVRWGLWMSVSFYRLQTKLVSKTVDQLPY